MTPLQGEPPRIDFKLPKKLKKWLNAIRQFCIEIQPIGRGISQTVKGRLIKLVEEADAASASSVTPHRLQILRANAGGVGKTRVRLGKVAGLVADPGMTDPGDDPEYIITFGSTPGWKYIYGDVTVAWNATDGIWEATDCEIGHLATIPTNDATHIYVEIGQVNLEAITGGYAITEVIQTATGDLWVARISGESAPYVDHHGH